MRQSEQRFFVATIAVYTTAVLVRFVLALTFGDHAPVIADARDYDGLATRLVEAGHYLSESGRPISLRPPLFPALVAGVYAIAGIGNYVALALVQSLVSLGTMVCTQKLGQHLADARTGLLAAALVGFYPSLLAFNCLVLSETLFTFFFTLSVLASIKLQRAANWRWACLLGVVLALGALTRSILWVCTPPILVWLWSTMDARIGARTGLTALALLCFAVVLAPWSIRNTRLHETFTVVDVMGGRNVMMGNYEHTPLERSWATVTDVRGQKAWDHVLRDAHPEARGMTQGQIDKLAMRYGLRYFFSHPQQSAIRSVVRFFNFWQLERTIVAGMRQGIWGDASLAMTLAVAAVVFGSYAVVLFGGILGFFACDLGWRQQMLLLLWVALPCAIHTAAFAHSRYHLPLIPILAVYAAIAAGLLKQGRLRKGWVPAVLVCSVLVAGWIREIVMVDLGSF